MTTTSHEVGPSPLLGREGAVVADGPDAGVAWHHGDPVREQRLLLAGEAVADLSHRGVVTVSGPDRLTWLDTLTTQWLRDLAPGAAREALVLSPHGHVEHALHLVDDGATTWITVEPGAQAALVAHLERMRFMLRVEVADVTADWAVVAHVPVAGAGPVVDSPLPAWDDPWPRTADGGVRYCLAPDEEHPGAERAWREVLLPRQGWWRPSPTARWRAPGRARPCGWRRGVPASGSRPTTARSRTRSTGCAPPCTCRRGATAGRRRWPGSTTSAAPRGGSCSSTSTARATSSRSGAPRSSGRSAPWVRSPASSATTSWARWRSRW